MTLRALASACWVVAVLVGCASDPPAALPAVSTGGDGDGDGDGDDRDASGESGSGGSDQPELDASSGGSPNLDASDPDRPAPPAEDGVHLSVDGEPYETANDVFYFEAPRPGIQAEFRTAQLRVGMTATPGVFTCDDGATID